MDTAVRGFVKVLSCDREHRATSLAGRVVSRGGGVDRRNKAEHLTSFTALCRGRKALLMRVRYVGRHAQLDRTSQYGSIALSVGTVRRLAMQEHYTLSCDRY